MGVEYYLIDKENKEYYELGKGYWCSIFCYSNEIVLNKKYKDINKFINKIKTLFCIDKDSDDEEIDYCEKIAKEIYEFCRDKKVYITSDCDDNFNDLIFNNMLKEVGSRYN